MNERVTTQEFTITPKLYRTVISHAMLRRTQGFIWFAVAIPMIIWVVSQGNLSIALSWLPFVLFMGVWFAVTIYGFPYWLSLSKTNPICPYVGSVIFEADAIQSIRQHGGIVKRGWQEFSHITIEKEAFVFWERRRVFMIIPFTAFSLLADKETVKAKIHQEMNTPHKS